MQNLFSPRDHIVGFVERSRNRDCAGSLLCHPEFDHVIVEAIETATGLFGQQSGSGDGAKFFLQFFDFGPHVDLAEHRKSKILPQNEREASLDLRPVRFVISPEVELSLQHCEKALREVKAAKLNANILYISIIIKLINLKENRLTTLH